MSDPDKALGLQVLVLLPRMAAKLAGKRSDPSKALNEALEELLAAYVQRCEECRVWIPVHPGLLAEGEAWECHLRGCSHRKP